MRVMSARIAILTCCLLLAASGLTPCAADDPAIGAPVAPVDRFDTHLRQGEQWVRDLPEGTMIAVTRADGSNFGLELRDDAFHGQLPKSTLEEDGVVVTPFGYRLFIDSMFKGTFCIESPNGKRTRFLRAGRDMYVFEDDGGAWLNDSIHLVLRLPDGSRIDFLDVYKFAEVLTLHGERFKLDIAAAQWEQLPAIPSPPLVPEMRSFYVAGDGNDWRRPAHEDHVVFAWNWFPYPLKRERLLKDLETGNRRDDLRFYFIEIANVMPAQETGGTLIARRLALTGGDLLTIRAPGEDPQTVYVFPGAAEPDFILPPAFNKSPELNLKLGR